MNVEEWGFNSEPENFFIIIFPDNVFTDSFMFHLLKDVNQFLRVEKNEIVLVFH